MAPHKEYQYFIIQLGSQVSHIQFDGLSALHDTLPSKTITVPTRVYRHPSGQKNYYSSHSSAGDGSDEVKFLENGLITNNNAFNYFVKLIVKSILKYSVEDRQLFTSQALNIHLVVVTSSSVFENFSKIQLQKSVNYFYENVEHLASVSVLSNGLSLLFAHGSNSINTSLVVDVGYNKVSFQPIVDYLPINFATLTLPVGGNSINDRLARLLPDLSAQQIEDLKRSEVFEILSEANKNSKNTDLSEDDIDVLKIVNSNKPKELLLEREKAEKTKGKGKKSNADAAKEKPKANSELESNKFIDSQGNELTIGKQRFLGSEELISTIDYYINYVISKYPDFAKRQELWNNIILNGDTVAIKGFKEYLYESLKRNHLVSSDPEDNDPESKFRSTGNTDPSVLYSQAPTSIRILKKPEYFQEWKDSDSLSFTDLTVLGTLVFVRLCFGPGSHHSSVNNIGNELYVVKKEDFEESGPDLIWDMNH